MSTAPHPSRPAATVPSRHRGAVVTGALVVLSLLVVVALWVAGGGPADLLSRGTAVTSFGRLTGLLATDLMLLQVLLMARVPVVERAVGQDRLARWHRVVGLTSFHLMVVHIVAITVGYDEPAGGGLLAQAWELVTTYPGMLLAAAGAALLVGVTVTSWRIARRRLRYESWHLLHLYAYLGVGLAVPHQLWTGTEFAASPATRAYLTALYGVTAAVVVVFRLGLPAWRTMRHQVQVAEVVPEGPGAMSVYLRGRHLDRLPARAGQFFVWRFRAGRGWSRAHPYSLSAPPTSGRLRITVKDLGDGSGQVRSLTPGTKVVLEGPYGRLTGDTYHGRGVTMMASGIGITPLRALAEELEYPPGGATLLYRVHDDADVVFRRELATLTDRRGLRVVYLPGQRAASAAWRPRRLSHLSDVGALRHLVPDIARHDVYICGPQLWMAAARVACRRAGVPWRRIHRESFSW